MPKKNKAEELKRDNAPLNLRALNFLFGGCAAEIYLLMVRKYYINGNVDQMLGWDAAMPTLIGIGAAVLALGAILAIVWRKTAGWKRTFAWTVVFAGLFFSVGNWLVKEVYPSGATILCFVTAAAMLLGVLWCLYARDCFYAMVVLGTGLFATWVCRHGMDYIYWKSYGDRGAGVYLVLLLAAVALTARKVERADGMMGAIRVCPRIPIAPFLFATCGLSAAAATAAVPVQRRAVRLLVPCGCWEIDDFHSGGVLHRQGAVIQRNRERARDESPAALFSNFLCAFEMFSLPVRTPAGGSPCRFQTPGSRGSGSPRGSACRSRLPSMGRDS